MTLSELQQRAMAIRAKYAALEIKRYGKQWTATQLGAGFVGDVGDLMKLIMAKEGVRDIANVDEKLAHELADCLWSVLVLADALGVDLEKSFVKTMDVLDQHISDKLSHDT